MPAPFIFTTHAMARARVDMPDTLAAAATPDAIYARELVDGTSRWRLCALMINFSRSRGRASVLRHVTRGGKCFLRRKKASANRAKRYAARYRARSSRQAPTTLMMPAPAVTTLFFFFFFLMRRPMSRTVHRPGGSYASIIDTQRDILP